MYSSRMVEQRNNSNVENSLTSLWWPVWRPDTVRISNAILRSRLICGKSFIMSFNWSGTNGWNDWPHGHGFLKNGMLRINSKFAQMCFTHVSLTHSRQAYVHMVCTANDCNSFWRIAFQISSNCLYKFCNKYPFSFEIWFCFSQPATELWFFGAAGQLRFQYLKIWNLGFSVRGSPV